MLTCQFLGFQIRVSRQGSARCCTFSLPVACCHSVASRMLGLVVATCGVDRGSSSSSEKYKSQAVHAARSRHQIVLKGERHTSTNFMHSILLQSFGSGVCTTADAQCAACDDTQIEPTPTTYCCWKHGYANSECHGWYDSDPYPDHVFMERSIYPWLLSMHDEPFEYYGLKSVDKSVEASFSDFIRQPFSYAPEDGGGAYNVTDTAENPIQLWNAKLSSYQEFMSNVTGDITYINITTDTLYDLDKLRHAMQPLLDDGYTLIKGQEKISYPPMSNGFNGSEVPGASTGADWDYGEFLLAKLYDAQQLWKGLLTQDDVDFINSQVNISLMKKAGFDMVYDLNQTAVNGTNGTRTHVYTESGLTRAEHLQHLRYLDDPRGARRNLHKLTQTAHRRRSRRSTQASRTSR